MSGATSSSDPTPSFADLIVERLPQLLPDHPRVLSILPVLAPGGFHANIRRVILSSGQRIIAKRHLFRSLAGDGVADLSAEQDIARLLSSTDVDIPDVVAIDPEISTVYYQDAGADTLDDAIQTRSPVERYRLAENALRSFIRLQTVLTENETDLAQHVLPGCDRDAVDSSFRAISDHLTQDRLSAIATPPRSINADQVHALVTALASSPTLLGPTDYNARNIVVRADSVAYLEVCKLGYDWAERRLVQYLTSLGSGRPGARPRSLIDRMLVRKYGEIAGWTTPENATFALDAHHLIFHLLLAMRWQDLYGEIPVSVRTSLSTQLSQGDDIQKIRKAFG